MSDPGKARFTQGSILRHILVTTAYGAVGMMTLFLVDFADLFFLSLLGEQELAAAVGYAGVILFYTTSICIGLAIAMGATVARAIGAGNMAAAQRYAAHNAILAVAATLPITLAGWIYVPELLGLLGAEGRTLELAIVYLRIVLPSMPLLALAMAGGGILRAAALPRLAMWSTVWGGLVNLILDPILIFWLDMGVAGAAVASVAARLAVLLVAWRRVFLEGGLIGVPQKTGWLRDARAYFGIALPAMATNLATPVGSTAVIEAMSRHGDAAVAGYAIVERTTLVAFAAIFALSGTVGPILGQNAGAGLFERVRRTLWDALLVSGGIVLLAAAALFLLQDRIVALFEASGEAAEIVLVFTNGVTLSFLFTAALFVSNAAFNNLGRPLWSTLSNWSRATLGTIPLVLLGDLWFGAAGILWGYALGAVIFGSLAFTAALWLAGRQARAEVATLGGFFRVPLAAFASYRGWIPSGAALVAQEESEREGKWR